MQNNMFQPGVILQEVIIGEFKAQGLTFRRGVSKTKSIPIWPVAPHMGNLAG